jgi:hypothetical protein
MAVINFRFRHFEYYDSLIALKPLEPEVDDSHAPAMHHDASRPHPWT